MFAAVVGQSWATTAHPFNIEVNGTDVIGSVSIDSVRIEMAGPGSNGSMTFTISDPTAAYDVADWDEVRFIEHAATRPILFGGFVQAVRYRAWAATGRDIEVTCVGYGILLEKKVVAWAAPTMAEQDAANTIVSVVNRFGGRISAFCAGSDAAVDGPYQTDAVYSVADPSMPDIGSVTQQAWRLGRQNEDEPYDFLPTGMTGVQTLGAWLAAASGASWYYNLDTAGDSEYDWSTAAPILRWVDSTARLRVYPVVPTDWVTLPDIRDALYDGGSVPAVSIYSATTGIISMTREFDGAAKITVAVGDNESIPQRLPATARAGDLETAWTDQVSFLGNIAAKYDIVMSGERTERMELVISQDTPVNIWPGLSARITLEQLGATNVDLRVTSVSIVFHGGSSRSTAITLGDNSPSFVNS
jgi:hypothetical protein